MIESVLRPIRAIDLVLASESVAALTDRGASLAEFARALGVSRIPANCWNEPGVALGLGA